jgi:hypothetical protein
MILQSKMFHIRTFIRDCILVLSEDTVYLKRKTKRKMYEKFCLAPSACVLPQQLRSLLLSHMLQLSAVVTMTLSCKLVPYIV